MEGGAWREQRAESLVLTSGAANRVGFIPHGQDADGRSLWIEAKMTGTGSPHEQKPGAEPIGADELLEALRRPLGC